MSTVPETGSCFYTTSKNSVSRTSREAKVFELDASECRWRQRTRLKYPRPHLLQPSHPTCVPLLLLQFLLPLLPLCFHPFLSAFFRFVPARWSRVAFTPSPTSRTGAPRPICNSASSRGAGMRGAELTLRSKSTVDKV